MEVKTENIREFFHQIWTLATDKHQQGVYNTACLAVLLALPLLVLLTALLVCCHCCCCRHGDGCCRCCCCCRGRRGAVATARSETKKKKKNSSNTEDLWISVKPGPMTPDRVALAMV